MSAEPSPSRARRVAAVARIERRKLFAQPPLRVTGALAVLGPFAFALLIRVQGGAPADALYGAWVHTSGVAVTLVVLSFACNWGFPLLAGVVAGDLFAAEDRLGTWKTILTRSVSLHDAFLGKVRAAMELTVGLGLVSAAAAILAGLTVSGAHGLVDLGGTVRSPVHMVLFAVLSWVLCLLPALAYTAIGILVSIATRSGIAGVLGPVVISLLAQLLALVGSGTVVHVALISSPFDAWHGLFATDVSVVPLVVSALVALAWIAGSLWAARAILLRREFTADSGAGGRTGWRAALRGAAAAIAVLVALALLSGVGSSGVTARRLTVALAGEFRRLTLLQQGELGHPIPAGARYIIVPVCGRRGDRRPVGPGQWSCTMNVYVLLPGSHPLTNTPVAYDVSVRSDGCFKADSPPAYVGPATIRDAWGRSIVNPLVTIYGCFDVL